jgi:hypothetical protein
VIGVLPGYSAASPIYYSYDGLNFFPSSSANASPILGGNINKIAYNGNQWVAVGVLPNSSAGCILYSWDGVTWLSSASAATLTSGNTYGITSVAWGGNQWIAGTAATAGQNSVIYSYDGNIWYASGNGNAAAAAAGSSWIRDIAYNGNTWFVTVNNNAGGGIYSTDGTTWSVSGSPAAAGSNTILSIATNGSLFVATAGVSSAVVIYSYDGNNWTSSASGSSIFSAGYASVACNGSMWVAGSTQNVIGYSYDGIKWTQSAQGSSLISSCSGGGVLNLTWNGTIWIGTIYCPGSTFNIVYSPDGINWTPGVVSGTNPTTTFFSACASRRALPFVGTNIQGNFQASPTGPTGAGSPSSYFLNTVNANLYQYQGTGWNSVLAMAAYNPTTSANWAGTAPTTIGAALDRIAIALNTLSTPP